MKKPMSNETSAFITLIVILTVTATLLILIGLRIPSSINLCYLLGIWILIVSFIFPGRMMKMRKEKEK